MNNLSLVKQYYSNDILYHLEQLQADLYRMQIGNNRNFILFKSIEVLIAKIEMIKGITQDEIRFDYLKIQDEMERLYKEDNSITGVTINYDFKESENPNRALIQMKKIKEDEKAE